MNHWDLSRASCEAPEIEQTNERAARRGLAPSSANGATRAREEPQTPEQPSNTRQLSGGAGSQSGPGRPRGRKRGRRVSADAAIALGGSGGGSNLSGGDTSAGPIPSATSTFHWVQCENAECNKWRKLPQLVDVDALPEKWYCSMNLWDPM
jgi:hypothetical protein